RTRVRCEEMGRAMPQRSLPPCGGGNHVARTFTPHTTCLTCGDVCMPWRASGGTRATPSDLSKTGPRFRVVFAGTNGECCFVYRSIFDCHTFDEQRAGATKHSHQVKNQQARADQYASHRKSVVSFTNA